MGTRRSKHNKGRKPLYKEHRSNLIEVDEKRAPATAPPVSIQRRAAAPAVEVQLTSEVISFLEKRREMEALRAAEVAKTKRHNLQVVASPEFVPMSMAEVDRSGISPRDVLIQMYGAKEISFSLFRTGREWQRAMERGTIQPGRSIDWSVLIQNAAYQRKGDLCEVQRIAMIDRAAIAKFCGRGFVVALDRCLGLDVGRRELCALFRTDWKNAREAIVWILRRLEDAINVMDGASWMKM